mmetsp:Transcript_120091/g.299578  ORF Transcript_120091/g.299578 Transcript_120091/m.299578 type:complete len:561 (-) Transcript_120091:44-1726(-)
MEADDHADRRSSTRSLRLSFEAHETANDGSTEKLTSAAVQQKIDEIGFGVFQMVMLLMTGGIMFAEGAEVLVMGTITTLLRGHWELGPVYRGALVSIVFVGFAFGNLLSGYIGDRYGRRVAILLGYTLIGSFGFLTGLAFHPAVMITLRFGVGMGCGIGFPSIYSLIPEVCPTKLRGSLSTLMIGFMPLGELYAALLVLLVDPELSHSQGQCESLAFYPNMLFPRECTWRSMCELSALPAFVFLGFSFFFLYESPHYLCSQGRSGDVNEVLRAMARLNWKDVEVNFAEPEESEEEPVRHTPREGTHAARNYNFLHSMILLWRPPFLLTTVFMFLSHFAKDFSVFGLNYVLPQFLYTLETLSLGVHLIIMATVAFPGVIVAFFLTKAVFIGHIESMQVCAACCAFFTFGMLEDNKEMTGAPCAFMAKAAAMAYFICTVVYTSEVFPTAMRNTAVGLCTCFGRAGSISAPLIFELSYEHAEGSFDIFMYFLSFLMCLIAVLAPFVLTQETKFQPLCWADVQAEATAGYMTSMDSGLSQYSCYSYGTMSDPPSKADLRAELQQ